MWKSGTTPPRVTNGNAPGAVAACPPRRAPRLVKQLFGSRKLPTPVGQEGGVRQGFANHRRITQLSCQRHASSKQDAARA